MVKIISSVIIATVIMTLVDGVFILPYYQKSIIKIILFLTLPLVVVENKKQFVCDLFGFNKKSILLGLTLGSLVFVFLFGGYFIIRNIIDFSSIVPLLDKNMGINKNNFIFVAIYIAIINSLLEEFFFRGFAFLQFKKSICLNNNSNRVSYIFSAGMFAFYHIAMMVGWVSPFVLMLGISGLFIGGLIFNWLADKYDSIYASWIMHILANFGINSVGMTLFHIADGI